MRPGRAGATTASGGKPVTGKVVVYDDDTYYTGGALAERFRQQGHDVCLVTPDSIVSSFSAHTLEQKKIQHRLLDLGIEIIVSHEILRIDDDELLLANVYHRGHQQSLSYDTLVLVTSRISNDDLYQDLLVHQDRFKTLRAIGDCHAPGIVAAAVYDGHSAARDLERDGDPYAPLFNREIPALD